MSWLDSSECHPVGKAVACRAARRAAAAPLSAGGRSRALPGNAQLQRAGLRRAKWGGARLVAALIAAVLFPSVVGAQCACACTTPVYRYAMYNWATAPYYVFYFHHGQIAPEDQAVHELIRALGQAEPPANLVLELVDARDQAQLEQLPQIVVDAWHACDEGAGEPVSLVYTAWGAHLFSGHLDAQSVAALVDSPARKQIGRAFDEGHAGVLLILSGRDAEANAQAEKAVAKLVANAAAGKFNLDEDDPYSPAGPAPPGREEREPLGLEQTESPSMGQPYEAGVAENTDLGKKIVAAENIGAPENVGAVERIGAAEKTGTAENIATAANVGAAEADQPEAGFAESASPGFAGELVPSAEAEGGAALEEAPPGFKLAVVKLARDDKAEQWLIRSLLAVEPDLDEFPEEPMVFAIYGRGRALPPFIGKGINYENLVECVYFLMGPCSCMIKDQNPGMDLLMAWDWDKTADRWMATDESLAQDDWQYDYPLYPDQEPPGEDDLALAEPRESAEPVSSQHVASEPGAAARGVLGASAGSPAPADQRAEIASTAALAAGAQADDSSLPPCCVAPASGEQSGSLEATHAVRRQVWIAGALLGGGVLVVVALGFVVLRAGGSG